MKIEYGIVDNKIDVTDIVFTRLKHNNNIIIPSNDEYRNYFFTDPCEGSLKNIYIYNKNEYTQYDHTCEIYIDTFTNKIYTLQDELPEKIKEISVYHKLINIQNQLKLEYGSFSQEFPEQRMVTKYLKGHEKVLEIGGNIGRNSLIISYILNKNNNYNFVCLESDKDICNQLKHNRDINNGKFFIENSALSKRNLIQKEWNTIVSDELLDGYSKVNTITFEELKNKYNIDFDTLVLDCEGAFYYILLDMPELLNEINLIIMENDYLDVHHKIYIDNVFTQNNFYVDYMESGGWGPCYSNFFEVWKKKN